MLRKFLLVQMFLLLCVSITSLAQANKVNIDNLNDDQIRRIVAEMKQNNMSMDDIDSYAEQRGVPASEADKLKTRIQMLGLDKVLDQKNNTATFQPNSQFKGRTFNETDTAQVDLFRQNSNQEAIKKKKIFGSELFSNQNLTFEPNLRLPTPKNYRLAADDQLLVDVYGYSETQYNLTVSTEGYVRIPNVGPVYVNGLTIEEAKTRITKQLSTIYSTINSGKTFVQVSLGNIRSIRVLLIGEIRKPGTYTLPSLATIANALYASGGPDDNGSFRSIDVIRNGSKVVTFDLYDFLTRGDLSNNIVLQDQDIIKVNPYQTRVELIGEVKRPAIFEAKENETLKNIIDYAGGYTDGSFTENITAYRINNKEREVVNIKANEIATFKLKSGDQFFVDSILNRFTNRVTITGAVFHPGNYGLESGMMLSDLIKKADGIREEANLERGLIRRLNDDFSPAVINFNLADVLTGKTNLLLRKEDSVLIFSKFDLRPTYTINIRGEVNHPGTFLYADSMRLEDLILLAGGLTDAASLQNVELSRRFRREGNNSHDNNQDTSIAIVRKFNISEDLTATEAGNITLQPFDELFIRKSPTYIPQANMVIEGEVLYPGQYTIISKGEHISDIIKRAGGLKSDAFPEGAVLLRKTYINSTDSALLNYKLALFYNKLEDSTAISSVKNMMNRQYQLLGIKLEDILKHPGSKQDILLEEGDVLKVPKKLQTVQLFGEIYFPKKIRFDNGYTFRDYIRGAGGFTTSSLKRRSYIVYPNGEVKSTRKVFFFNRYPKVKPGSEIYVPNKKEKKGLTPQESVGLISGLATVALIIITLIDKIK